MSISYNDLINKLDSIRFEEKKFGLWTETGKTAMVMTSKGSGNPAGEMTSFRAIYMTVSDLSWKIKVSLQIAGGYAIENENGFNPFDPIDNKKRGAIYYIENALFRETSLWDMLAQGYRVLYDVKKNLKNNKIDINNVKYKSFFDPAKTPHTRFEKEADEIYQYVTGDNWHSLVSEIRNQMMHKFSPNIPIMSNYTMNLPYPLTVQIQAILEDFIVVSSFLHSLFETAELQILSGLQEENNVQTNL